jgi:hypothetical protein
MTDWRDMFLIGVLNDLLNGHGEQGEDTKITKAVLCWGLFESMKI